MNTDKENELVAAFTTAARELGFRFTSPLIIGNDSFLGLVQDFGSPKGTVIFLLGLKNDFTEVKQTGHFFSELAGSYCVFNRKIFEETLNDWGYFGPASEKPSWFTGQPWS
ncbi:hypothetical protein [Methylobacter sp.]|uniref:hypothetical protein n=1 Tax=Methylobacter sp. TaxID=2051955 RepID=UPI00122206FE|nr:hypothetical protein [Methylobacter sp.]TAK63178.1 MAG: hypothetical protein EPO18_07650 [Methylobacter sp.]